MISIFKTFDAEQIARLKNQPEIFIRMTLSDIDPLLSKSF